MIQKLRVSLVARLIGRCERTLRGWDLCGVYIAKRDWLGRFYDETDLLELRQLAETRKSGRPRKPDSELKYPRRKKREVPSK